MPPPRWAADASPRSRLRKTATWIERQQQLAQELRGYLQAGGRFDFHGLLDPTQLIRKSRIQGAALELTEVRDILDAGRPRCRMARSRPASAGRRRGAVAGRRRAFAAASPTSSPLLHYFRNKILPDGTLDDRASPELARIRRDIERQRRSIHESLRSYLRKLSDGGAVQDELITIRGDRFVIPVKTEQRRRVQGVAHGASSSGQTVFIEPLETIEQNNELVRLLDDELAEIHRILVEMTTRIGEQAAELEAAVGMLAELELQFAKARFARDYDCVPVKLLEDGADAGIRSAQCAPSPARAHT